MFFRLCNDEELRDKAYDKLFSLCDSAVYLYDDGEGSDFKYDNDSIETECKEAVEEVIKCEKTALKMKCAVSLRFQMSPEIAKMIKSHGLDGDIVFAGGKRLRNLTLFGKKEIYSVCRDDDYEKIDYETEKTVSEFCLREIEKTALYKTLRKKAIESSLDYDDVVVARTKLYSLDSYVKKDCRAWSYIPPRYELSYAEYLELARGAFTDDVIAELESASRFKELHVKGYPRTLEELGDYIDLPDFTNSALYRECMRELMYLDAAYYKEKGFEFPEGLQVRG